MPIQSLSQDRINDPILTAFAYGQKVQGLIGTTILPIVSIEKRGLKIPKFGDTNHQILYATRRAPGDDINYIEVTYGDVTVELYQDAIAGRIPIERTEEAIIDLQEETVIQVKMALANRLEKDIFDLVSNFAGYPATNRVALVAATQFSNAGVDPIPYFDAANQAVLAGINMLPNTIIYGGLKAFNALKNNPRIREQFKTISPDLVNLQMMNNLLGYPTGKMSLASYVLPNDQATKIPFFDNSIWIGYVPGNGNDTNPTDMSVTLNPLSGANKRQPAFGYTFMRKAMTIAGNETGLVFDQPEYESMNRSWFIPAVVDRLPALTGMAGGYLITNVAA